LCKYVWKANTSYYQCHPAYGHFSLSVVAKILIFFSIHVTHTASLPTAAHSWLPQIEAEAAGIRREKKKITKTDKANRVGDTFETRGCVPAKERGHQRCLKPPDEQELGTLCVKVLFKIPKMLIHTFISHHLSVASQVSKHKRNLKHRVHLVAPLGCFCMLLLLGKEF